MFRKNRDHFQEKLIEIYTVINPKTQARLKKSWAALFYEHVFCKIDEEPFAALYCQDNGRPNFPINILLSLEFIKNMKDYTDEEILEEFEYNVQIAYAVGLNIGDLRLAPRTLYEFRRRLYEYTVQHPDKEDLVFGQFETLTKNFTDIAGISTKEQRMDSTQIRTNIKHAGRLSLAYDVLVQAIKACPQEMLTGLIRKVLDPEYKIDTLYRVSGKEARAKRLQEMIDLGVELLELLETHPDILSLDSLTILHRFIQEQACFDFGKKVWIVKESKYIAADSLQSAYDSDVTYRKKSGKGHVGLVANLSETCADENPIQLVTDYVIEKNVISDTGMLKERLRGIKARTGLTDLNVDGGYFSGDVEKDSQDIGVEIHYTEMTGSEPEPEKNSVTSFVIKDHKIVEFCPQGHAPYSCQFNGQTNVILACFNRDICASCPLQSVCPVEMRKNNAVLRIKQNTLFVAEARDKVKDKQARKDAGRKRAAIEGTNSSLKRSQGAGKLRVRGIVKARLVMGMKIIGHNFAQIVNLFTNNVRKETAKIAYRTTQGDSVPI